MKSENLSFKTGIPGIPKISKSVQTSFKLKKNISSSHNLSTEKDIYANSLKLSPMDTLTHLHIPQYRPLPAHKLGIISEDLSSAFPVLDFTFQQKYRDQQQQQHQSVSASATLSSSGTGSTAVTVYTTTVISPSVINTSLTNYESQQTNIYDNSLTHSYDKSSIRLMLSENTNQNYPIVYYNQKVCDYNKYFPEQSIALTDRSIVSKQDQSSTAKFSYPGGDSGMLFPDDFITFLFYYYFN
ncbi:unnamed protein product [Trichobilharzia regenti]|nr:unnamed protein product [Trichobilharzia regenti]